ncbi:MAG: CcoQ/FixQ family Cbb3-type cytochrome c oxidase assembly chaperone [Hyphomicrobiales bacterium]|nr:cbb3-type cytochrome c oxidase subunit 3 [Hyphomicrobiales bacterium]PCJ86762.1 MAG: CcoQ/FixQ family Cbb3-type cytochrome c oxidase assembly chaperone [Hyphomicrobiales bacterium]
MDYENMRVAANSWGLVYLFILFVGVLAFTFRPGTKKQAEHTARILFEEDE